MIDALVSFFGGLNPWLVLGIIAATPFGEARVSIIYGLAMGLDPLYVFLLSVALNIMVLVPLLFALRQKWVMKIIHFVMGKRITRMVEKNKKKFEIYEELALLGFVAVPLVGTGAWTGALLSTVLELDAKKSFFVIASGVFLAASMIFLGANGVIYAME